MSKQFVLHDKLLSIKCIEQTPRYCAFNSISMLNKATTLPKNMNDKGSGLYLLLKLASYTFCNFLFYIIRTFYSFFIRNPVS